MTTPIVLLVIVLLVGLGVGIYLLVRSPSTSTKVVVPLGQVSFVKDAWVIQYSPGMPVHPTFSNSTSLSAKWYFDFPKSDGVHNIVVPYGQSKVHTLLAMTFMVDSVKPIYVSADSPAAAPASLRPYFQRAGDTMSGQGAYEFYRWWSNPVHYQLGTNDNTVVTLTVPITPAQWSSVLGKVGTASPGAFNDAWKNVANVGLTFGGEFFGHGVFISSGTSRFTLLDYKIT